LKVAVGDTTSDETGTRVANVSNGGKERRRNFESVLVTIGRE
jgi:hypothetical protein